MDWDSHRYLECFFAVPMMGAVLQTVNIRLSHGANHLHPQPRRAPRPYWCTSTSFRSWRRSRDKLHVARKFIVIDDGGERPSSSISLAAEYEELLVGSSPDFAFSPILTRMRAPRHSTPPERRGYRRASISAIVSSFCIRSPNWQHFGTAGRQGRFHRDDVYMPITPMFHVHAWGFPYAATVDGREAGLSRTLRAGRVVEFDQDRGRDFFPLRADHSAHAAD